MKRKISEMKQHVNSKKTFMAICLSSFNLLTCDPDINNYNKILFVMQFLSEES